MAAHIDQALSWLKDFKSTWLPEQISNDPSLREAIGTKLDELEHLLIQNDPQTSPQIIEEVFPQDDVISLEMTATQRSPERSLLTPPEHCPTTDDEHDHPEQLSRPSIRIKRISLEEAENFLPSAWTTVNPKRGRRASKKTIAAVHSYGRRPRRNNQRTKLVPLSNHHPISVMPPRSTRSKKTALLDAPVSTSSILSTLSTTEEKKKTRKKLRAIDAEDDDLFTLGNLSQVDHQPTSDDCGPISRHIGQNGILSQTRRLQDTLTTTTTNDDADFPIALQQRQTLSDEFSANPMIDPSDDVFLNPMDTESSLGDALTIGDDPEAINGDRFLEHHDADESLLNELEMLCEKANESSSHKNHHSGVSYTDCIEDISNDGIDSGAASSLAPADEELISAIER